MKPEKDVEKGITELIGTLLLIVIFIAAFAILGVLLYSQTSTEKTPRLNLEIASQGNTITVSHAGGDPISGGEYYILVDGVPRTFTGAASDNTWSIGQTLTYQSPDTPHQVDVVYVSPGGAKYLVATQTLGQNVRPTTIPIPPEPVVANFTGTPVVGLVPLTVQFTDASAGPVTSWSWLFGDGGTSPAKSPVHQFINNGTYTVSLAVSNGTGSDIISRVGYITVNSPVVTHIINGSASTSGGNVSPSGTLHVEHGTSQTFTITPDTGYRTANVLVDNVSQGAISSYTFTNVVSAHTILASFTTNPLVAGFTWDEPGQSGHLTFTDTTQGAPTSWNWNFGDGSTSTVQNPSHDFAKKHSYPVTLTVSRISDGATNSIIKTIDL